MQEHKTIVKNYEEYICFLKNQLGNCCCMPSYDEICDFIKKYHLDLEWDITPEDVVADVKQEIQKAEVKNRVSSYEEYLQALKEYFGIPDMMPESI